MMQLMKQDLIKREAKTTTQIDVPLFCTCKKKTMMNNDHNCMMCGKLICMQT